MRDAFIMTKTYKVSDGHLDHVLRKKSRIRQPDFENIGNIDVIYHQPIAKKKKSH